ncbi:type II toxin-antitoxin system VapC family toxin [Archaeoglobus neptunius]|uniref:type II toxin-antitoxin system VapC family toxin n=1 Tax=Archaeoglobus neptunius TaxID=2798580 RepID=UPI0038B22FF9
MVEFTSALRRKADERVIRQKEVSYVLTKFHEDLANFIILKFDSNVISNAVEFVMRHRLKTLDSLQLSFAMKLKEYDPLFVSFDRKLLDCAKLEGFRVLDI